MRSRRRARKLLNLLITLIQQLHLISLSPLFTSSFIIINNFVLNLVMVLTLSWFILSRFFRGFRFSCEAKKVTLNDFNIEKPLGRGKFGHIYLAREKTVSFQLFLNFLSQITIIWHCVIGGWVLGTMFIVYCCFACAFYNIHFVGKNTFFCASVFLANEYQKGRFAISFIRLDS